MTNPHPLTENLASMNASNQIVETIFYQPRPGGRRARLKVKLSYTESRIEFLSSPFELKDEIKAMRGSKWLGHEGGPKIWAVENCPRNRFQIECLEGKPVYAWFDRPLVRHEYTRPLMAHQRDMADAGLTYHFQILAGEQGTRSIVVVGFKGIRRLGDGRDWRPQADLRPDAVNQRTIVGNERDCNLWIVQIATAAPFPVEEPLRE